MPHKALTRRRPLTRTQHRKAARLANDIYDQLAALRELVGGDMGTPYQRTLAAYQDRLFRRVFEPLIDAWEAGE